MPEKNQVTELARLLASSRILLSSDISPELIGEADLGLIAAKLIETHMGQELAVVQTEELKLIVEATKLTKAPLPIEVGRHSDFRPVAAEVDSKYSISNTQIDRAEGSTTDFVNYFKDRLHRMRSFLESHRNNGVGFLQNIESIKSLSGGREVCIIGLVSSASTTQKGNILVRLEDETGEANVMFMNGTSSQAKVLFEAARGIINDEVLAIKGKIATGAPFVYASEIIWPDIPIRVKKETEDDVAIAFMSDIHVGSKRFMEKNFMRMLEWLNGNVDTKYKELAGKIKYIVMAGDVADGIGVYPGQDRDLAILDIYAQYSKLFNFIDAIPDYIEVFVMPGNHDAVQRAEPQQPLGGALIKEYSKSNVHLLSNPAYANLHGFETLAYHGTSLDSIIAAVPGTSYAQPEKAMVEVLRRRHLSPIYGGNVIVPTKEDHLVIDRVPDIMHMGHIHKNGIANYHGVEIVNSGTWQARTDFQMKQGHVPSPCMLPVYELKSHKFTTVDFNTE